MLPSSLIFDSNNFITCGLCRQTLEDPVSLPCGHLFCFNSNRKCLAKICRGKRQIICPNCHSTFSLKLENFKSNKYLHNLVRRLSEVKSPTFGICPRHEDFPLEFLCKNCGEKICKICWKQHSKHSVCLIEIIKQSEFQKRFKTFDPHKVKLQNRKRQNDVERQLKLVQKLQRQVDLCHEALESERQIVDNLRYELPKLKIRMANEDFDSYYSTLQKVMNDAKRTLLESTFAGRKLRFSTKLFEGSTKSLENGNSDCLVMNESYCDSKKSKAPQQLAEAVSFIFESNNRHFYNPGILYTTQNDHKNQPEKCPEKEDKIEPEGLDSTLSNEIVVSSKRKSSADFDADVFNYFQKRYSLDTPKVNKLEENFPDAIAEETENIEPSEKTLEQLFPEVNHIYDAIPLSQRPAVGNKTSSLATESHIRTSLEEVDTKPKNERIGSVPVINTNAKSNTATWSSTPSETRSFESAAIVASVKTVSRKSYSMPKEDQIYLDPSNKPKFNKEASYYYYSRPATSVVSGSIQNADYEPMPLRGSLDDRIGDTSGGNMLVGAFFPYSSTFFQVRSNGIRKCIWKDNIDSGSTRRGNLETIQTVVWERLNFPRCVTLGSNGDPDYEPIIYVGGFTISGDLKRVPEIWVLDNESLFPKARLNLKGSLKPEELETMNFQISANRDVLIVHVVKTQIFYVFKNQKFYTKLKAKVPAEISQIELRENHIVAGSENEGSVFVYQLSEKQNKLNFVDKKPVWGPVKARKGVFVVPDEEKDLVVCSTVDRNKLLLYNYGNKSRDVFDTFEYGYNFRKISGLQGGMMQGRDEHNKLFMLKLD